MTYPLHQTGFSSTAYAPAPLAVKTVEQSPGLAVAGQPAAETSGF